MIKSRLATQFKSADDSHGFLLWKLSNQWQAQQRAALKEFDLTHVQFVLLASLTFLAGETVITQAQLARHTQIDTMMTSQVLRALEKKGLLQREPSGVDARAFTVSVTKTGEALANKAVKVVEAVDTHFFGRLTAAQRYKLLAMMKRLVMA